MASRFVPVLVSAFVLFSAASAVFAADPCALVTPAEAAVVLGSDVGPGTPGAPPEGRKPAPASCTFSSAKEETVTIEVRTLNKPLTSATFADELKRLTEIYGPRGRVETIAGLGQFAFASYLEPREGLGAYRAAISVFQGTQQLSISVALNGRQTTTEQLKRLATAAVGRM